MCHLQNHKDTLKNSKIRSGWTPHGGQCLSERAGPPLLLNVKEEAPYHTNTRGCFDRLLCSTDENEKAFVLLPFVQHIRVGKDAFDVFPVSSCPLSSIIMTPAPRPARRTQTSSPLSSALFWVLSPYHMASTRGAATRGHESYNLTKKRCQTP